MRRAGRDMDRARRAIWAVLALLALAAIPSQAAETVPVSRAQISLTFAPLVKQAAPAVVNIYTRRIVKQRLSPFAGDPLFQHFFGGPGSPLGAGAFGDGGPVQNRVDAALGSGVIVDAGGLIVTNRHVIDGADEITVVLSDRREFDATVALSDPRTDLAVLKIDTTGETLPTLALGDSDAVQVGDVVLAIGNPFGVGQTVTMGIVSATARTAEGVSDYDFFIQTDAAINPGNSGGALLGVDGTLIGIPSAIYSRNGGSMGIGFAIPANMVKTVLASVQSGHRLQRPWLGAATADLTADRARDLGLKRPMGALVTAVQKGGPADRAGLQPGDAVTAVGGQAVDNAAALRFRIGTLPIGSTAKLAIVRTEEERQLDLPIEAPPETPPRDERTLQGNSPLRGATVANLSPAVADELSLPLDAQGVAVTGVSPELQAAQLGLQRGDIVLELDNRPIPDTATLEKALKAHRGRGWLLSFQRAGQAISLRIGG